MEEGKNYWISIDELKSQKTANNFQNYLPMFLEDGLNEAFGSWNDDEPWEMVYK
jgi:hypothetical protein